MSALAALSDEECELVAILLDDSGIELCEFAMVDEEQPDSCWRAYEYQYMWWRAEDRYQADWASRDVGKTASIIARALAFPFCFPGAEMLLTAPELSHLQPICDKIEQQLFGIRLLKEMLPRTRGNGIKKSPQFQVSYINNAHMLTRIPQRDGRGVKGIHALRIELDEAQDYAPNGFTEIIESMKTRTTGSQWRIHGVSRGVTDRFAEFCRNENPDLPFKVHRRMAMMRPSWGDEERRAKIALYGGTDDHVDYRRNVYGDIGDATSRLFVLHRLMACTRIAESPWAIEYNDEIYTQIKITDDLLAKADAPIELFLQFNGAHLADEYIAYWAGMDVGYTRDPSEVLIFGEVKHPKKKGESILRLLTRVHMMRVPAADQAAAVREIFNFYGDRLKRFSMDKTGNGLPLWQELDPHTVGTRVENRRTAEHISQRIKGYGFSNKVAVEFDDRELVKGETAIDAVIEKNVISFAADELRKLVDTNNLELPYDLQLLKEWQGQEIQYVRDESSAAGHKSKLKLTGGSLHTLDAAMMMIAGRNLMSMEQALRVAQPPRRPVLAQFMS